VKTGFQPLAERIREIVRRDASRSDRAEGIATEIRTAGSYRWVGIYEVTEREVRNIAFSGPGEPAHPTFARDKGLTGEMLRRNETVISGNVSNDPNYLTAFATTQSEMIVPVRARSGEIIGTIDIESESADAFNDEDRELAEALATIIEPLFWR
jgi:putative methionine-R-sulfoxide reductase with GAF domain